VSKFHADEVATDGSIAADGLIETGAELSSFIIWDAGNVIVVASQSRAHVRGKYESSTLANCCAPCNYHPPTTFN
jgi:hypothetical protein